MKTQTKNQIELFEMCLAQLLDGNNKGNFELSMRITNEISRLKCMPDPTDGVPTSFGELIVKDFKGNECDRISYNKDGLIIGWAVWSEACNAWLSIPTHFIKDLWPSKFEQAEDDILKEIEEQRAAI